MEGLPGKDLIMSKGRMVYKFKILPLVNLLTDIYFLA